MTKGDALEAEQMTAMLTGFVFSGLQKVEDVLTAPIECLECEPSGTIRFRLASGMVATVTLNVEPLVNAKEC